MDGVAVFLFGIVSTGLLGLWAGRCWQRAIDCEKTLEALAQKWEMADTVDVEFEEVESLLMDYAERLEKNVTASDLNEVLNEGIALDTPDADSSPMRGDPESVRDSALPEGREATDSHSDTDE